MQQVEGVPIRIRVGLNSGEVVVRSIGSDLHMDYTAVGQTTHLAARMEQLAAPGRPALTADTLRLVAAMFRSRPSGSVTVKGLGDPVDMYQLTGAAAARTRLHAAAPRGLTRFVGRDPRWSSSGSARKRPGQGTVRWSRWWESPAWASPDSSKSSPAPTGIKAGSCWSPCPFRTGR